MFVNLLATDTYVSYNTQLAQLLGLHEAIYLSELINIARKAELKNKLVNDFFVVDRKYITSRTTLKTAEQQDIDKRLSEIKLLKLGENLDQLNIDFSILNSLLLSKDEEAISDISKIAKKKPNKRQSMFDNLVSNIKTNNEELFEAYKSWITSVLQKQHWMSTKSVVNGEIIIDNYANGNLDLALYIIELADTNAYRDMEWAINLYESKHKQQFERQHSIPKPMLRKAELSDEVF